MARRPRTVQELTIEAGLDPDEACLALLEAGLNYSYSTQTVRPGDLAKARRVLGLPHSPPRADPSLVTELARRADSPEPDVREILVKMRVLAKRRLKRVPSHLLHKAEEVLGLRPSVLGHSVMSRAAGSSGLPQSTHLTPDKGPTKKRPKSEWPTIGPPQELIFLTPSDVEDLHFVLVKDFARSKDPIDPPGVRSSALLESAVHRPRTALGLTDKYPTVAMAGAALLHSIVLDHSFHNGNKRTALVALLAFLDKNGWVLTCDQDEIFEFLLTLADHKLVDRDGQPVVGADREAIHVAGWLQARIRKVALREVPVQFRHLRAILESYGCVLEHPRSVGNRINIRRDRLQTQVAYQKEGADVEKNTIHKIRRELELDEAHGYDSDIFYNRGPRIPEFINKYRKLLVRLAKV
jgi:death-on-curing family protein